MPKLKYVLVLVFAILFSVSCSLINNLKEKLGSKDENDKDNKEEVVKEETTGSTSQEDLQFYNKYIDVLNKISDAVEQFHKAYLNDVPDPKSVTKNSMIFVISADVYLGNIERLNKDYKRSYYDNGELAKLKADNQTMKNEIETDFKEVLKILEEYYNTSKEVIDYYKNKDYGKNPSLAKGYDDKMSDGYNKYKDAFDKLNSTVRKYKPLRTQRDPDKISNPDEKSVAVLMNTYENTLDGAEEFYEKFQKVDKNSDVTQLSESLGKFEKQFNEDKAKVESIGFTDKTKYMKYNFEDYFTKTVNDFIKEARKFFDSLGGKKMSTSEFNRGYDNVITYYNYMINAYNSSIGVLNSFQSY